MFSLFWADNKKRYHMYAKKGWRCEVSVFFGGVEGEMHQIDVILGGRNAKVLILTMSVVLYLFSALFLLACFAWKARLISVIYAGRAGRAGSCCTEIPDKLGRRFRLEKPHKMKADRLS